MRGRRRRRRMKKKRKKERKKKQICIHLGPYSTDYFRTVCYY
jgi:hypothetical protein